MGFNSGFKGLNYVTATSFRDNEDINITLWNVWSVMRKETVPKLFDLYSSYYDEWTEEDELCQIWSIQREDYFNTCTVHLIILYNEPTNAPLIDKLLYCSLLYCSHMFRHNCVIFRELVVSTLLSYISMSMKSMVITTHTQTQYILAQHNNNINIQTVYKATIPDFIRTVTTK